MSKFNIPGTYISQPKCSVRRDWSGQKWCQSIGLPLTKRRPDFQLDLPITQSVRAHVKLIHQLVQELAILWRIANSEQNSTRAIFLSRNSAKQLRSAILWIHNQFSGILDTADFPSKSSDPILKITDPDPTYLVITWIRNRQNNSDCGEDWC